MILGQKLFNKKLPAGIPDPDFIPALCIWFPKFLSLKYVTSTENENELMKVSWIGMEWTYFNLPFFQEGLQFLESSRNEIIYKTKKVEYILEKEKRARRGSQDINKMTRLRAWVLTKVCDNLLLFIWIELKQ